MTTCRPKTDARAQSGFTVIELMVTIAVMSILILIAAPGFQDAIMNVRMSALVNDLMADLALARSEAVKRGVPVRLCPSANQSTCAGGYWGVGWIVFVDDNNNGTRQSAEPLLKARPAVAAGTFLMINPGAGSLPFRPTGVTNITAAVNPAFTVCDGRTDPHRGRLITITTTGRPVVTRITTATCP